MKRVDALLGDYASSHRTRGNLAYHAAGIMLSVFGGLLLNIHRNTASGFWRQAVAPLAAIWENAGSRQMLGVATIYAFTAVGGKRAMAYATPETFGALYFALLGLLTLLLFGMTGPARLRVVREKPLAVIGIGVLMAVYQEGRSSLRPNNKARSARHSKPVARLCSQNMLL